MSNFYFFIRKEFYQLIFIALGAIPGVLIRWKVNDHFLVNILGTALLGLAISLPFYKKYYLLIGVGFCGALTTFSSWMVDSAYLFLRGSFLKALELIIYAVVCGLLSATTGFFFGRWITSSKLFLSRFLFRRH